MLEDNKGYIALHRKILDWEWYTEPNTTHLFIHCLLLANSKAKQWKNVEIKRGSFVTSLKGLADSCGMSVKAVRVALRKLEESGEIVRESNKHYTILTIKNYSNYQSQDIKNCSSKGHTKGTIKNETGAHKGHSKKHIRPVETAVENPTEGTQRAQKRATTNNIYISTPKGVDIYKAKNEKTAASGSPFGGDPPPPDKPSTKEVRTWFEEHGAGAQCAGDFYAESWTLNPNPDYSNWQTKAMAYIKQWKEEKARDER